jgi:tetratricopeptide (TPR) repeat protein
VRQQGIYYEGRGNAYLNLQEYDNARREYQEALKLRPKLYGAVIGLAEAYYQEEDWDNALKNYTSAIKIQPTSYALQQCGTIYAQLQQFEKAIEDFTAAINRVSASPRLKDWEKPIVNYTQVNDPAPGDARAFLGLVYQNRAEAYRQIGKESLALADEKRAEDLGE